ncbi:MAG: HAD family hydrolase [Bryobacteraceae bacterium]
MPASALVLFDIDGTLVRRAGPHHREVLVDAIRQVTGLETTTDGIPLHGMLDPDILTEMMRRVGVSSKRTRRVMPEVIEQAQRMYVRCCPDLRRKTCPGVRMVLQRLHRRGVVAGLVTGNLVRIGWKKMERAGLKHHFRFGAFAGMAPDRAALAALAIRHARRERWIRPGTPISLVGDAPTDIAAAKANGIRSVAVETGISTREELAALAPDVLLPSLQDLQLEEFFFGEGAFGGA